MPDAISASVLRPIEFDDGRGRLPDRIQAKAPRGMRSQIRRAAEVAGISAAAFIRQAVAESISKTLAALLIAPVAVLASLAGAAMAQSPVPPPDISPLDVSKNFVNGQPWSNGQQQITGPKVNGAFQTLFPIFNSMGTWDPVSGQFTINPLAATNFYGGQTVQKQCLTAGQSFTLPTAALPNVLVSVSDCTSGGAANPQLLSTPETINASSDATISGSSSFHFTLTGETVGFRRTQSNTWVPE